METSDGRGTIGSTLCGLETYLYPHTVLCNAGAERVSFAS